MWLNSSFSWNARWIQSIDSHVRPFISFGSMPNVRNSSYCEPGPMPRSNRPPERMSQIATSSATRIGSWNGQQRDRGADAELRRCFAATAVHTRIGEPGPLALAEVVLAVPRPHEAHLLGEHGVADVVGVHVGEAVGALRMVADCVQQ